MSALVLDPFDSVLAAFRAGRMVIVVDDKDRENEGDLAIAAEKITAADTLFMMRHGRGLVCASISVEAATRLNLPLQVLDNNSKFQTPFAISIDYRSVADRGVTASARAETMRQLANPLSTSSEFVSPGHVFPLVAHPAGVLGRRGQTEGSYDLAKLAGFAPAGVICEVLNADGTMARGEQLAAFAAKHQLPVTSVQEILDFRMRNEIAVREKSRGPVETDFGRFDGYLFTDDVSGKEHIALVFGDWSGLPVSYTPLVRIHSECLTGDVFGSRRCDCGSQLALSLRQITTEGCGILLYLRQEGRGIGLGNKLRAYELQDHGHDTVEANLLLGFEPDQRDFAVAAHILDALAVTKIRLMTNNPRKVSTLERYGVKVVDRIPVVVPADEYSKHYLETKRTKLGHIF